MARLNDPPAPPIESLDSLKRRFIRQNREIARVNSTQSQRIRNLESEISRLLAENITLREQAINAAAEAERWRKTSRIGNDVTEMKLRLQAKLAEVNAMVEELGELPERAVRRSSLWRRKSETSQNTALSPRQRDFRNKSASGDLPMEDLNAQDGRLPAILEDKYYPRRTLEQEELRVLTAIVGGEIGDTESPDLGPPPIAHFDVAESITFDSTKSPKRVSGGMVGGEDDVLSLPKNLETRRKRRTSSLLHDMSSLQTESENLNRNNEINTFQELKPSGKRKFEATEMEVATTLGLQNDGFEFSRRETSTTSRPRPSRFAARPTDRIQESRPEAESVSPQKLSQPRKVLAPKSTNSPSKRIIDSSSLYEKRNTSKDQESPKSKYVAKRVPKPKLSIKSPTDEVELTTNAPKTPAPPLDDILSPPSSAIDTTPPFKPTEAAITNSVEDVLNGSIGRGSRRARAAVSYAEPNLRDKMRRPDKKLVGAVEGLSKPSSTSDRESTHDPSREKSIEPTQSTTAIRVIKIKSETKPINEDKQWKNLPQATDQEAASPLQSKEEALKNLDMRKKRTFSESEGTKPLPATKIDDDESLDKAVSRLSIFDPPVSSPISATETTAKPRRHSVHPQTQPPPRPSSARDRETGKENIDLTASKLKRASSVQTLTQNQPATKSAMGGQTKGGALGARRRSMMV